LFRTGDFTEDFGGGLCPNVGLRAAVVVIEIVHDGLFQFVDALEDAAANAFLVISAKNRSTMLSHEPEVGVKCK
jgi:hypothetical protein